MRTLIIIVATALLTAGGFIGWRKLHAKEASTEEAATAVRFGKVARGELAETIQAPGEIEPRTRVQLSAKVSARINDLPYDEGDRVTAGDSHTSQSVLVRLDATDLEAAVRSAKARYAAQQAQIKVAEARIAAARASMEAQRILLNDARKEMDRESNLLQTRNTSQQAYDQAKRKVDELERQLEAGQHGLEADMAAMEASRHSLEAADADIARAEEDLRNATIVSPIDGIVTRVNAKVGELVMTGTMNNAGTVIMEVADLSRMLLVAMIDEANIAAVRTGQPAEVHLQAYPNDVFKGKVISVALASKEKDKEKNFTAEILLEPTTRRIPSGLSGDADIETSRHSGVLKVPTQCVLGRPLEDLPSEVRKLVPEPDKKAMALLVCKNDKGKAKLVPVDIGPSDATHTMITSGLAEGDEIVVGPYKILDTIKHDQKIKPEDESTTASKKKD